MRHTTVDALPQDSVHGTPFWATGWLGAAAVLALAGLFAWYRRGAAVMRTQNLALQAEIDERRIAEDALRMSEEHLRVVVANTPVILFALDAQGVFTLSEGRGLEAVGLGPGEVEGQSAFFLYRDDALFIQNIRAAFEGEERHWVGQVREKSLDTRVMPVRDEQGKVTGVIGVATDVTASRRAAEEREVLIRELEAKNAELEHFTYIVSHDLKSPLHTIKGFAGLLRKALEKGDYERLRSDVARIDGAAEKMELLLRELLELSRVGRQTAPREPVPLSDAAQEALAMIRGLIAERGVAVMIAEDLPTVRGDRLRLVQVFQNLLENAAKFMGDQPRPQIEVGVRGEDARSVVFVRDNGQGVDPQHRDKVFGLFERLDVTGNGTGIGLALVRRIVEIHGGRVWIESEGKGKGTTVCFTVGTDERQRAWRPSATGG